MNLLLEADYSSAESIIDGIKTNKIPLKNGKNLINNGNFKPWLKTFISLAKGDNLPIGKVLSIAIDKSFKSNRFPTTTDIDALSYYAKYKSSPNFKDLFNKFETTSMSLNEFHNKVQEMADNTKNGKRALRKAETAASDIETIYSKNGWTIVVPKTWQASVKAATFSFGKAPWCTASSSAEIYFKRYTGNGKHKLFIVSGGTKDKTLQVVFGNNADLEGWDNDGTVPDLDKFPDEVLKICKEGNKSLYDFAHLNDKYKDVVRTKKEKNGWKSTTTLRPFGENNFYLRFPKYIKGNYDSFEQIMKDNKSEGISSFVSKTYSKGGKKIEQRYYHGGKIFDKHSDDVNDDFWGIVNDREYEREEDLPRKVKSDVYTRKTKRERAELKMSDKDFAFEKQTINPDNPNYDKLFELGIDKYGAKKGEPISMAAHYLAPINTHKRYPIIYLNMKHFTANESKELFKFCMIHFFKKFVKDWQKRGNLMHDIINGNTLEEDWKQKVLNILK